MGETVKAKWVGAHEAELPSGEVLSHGDVHEVTPADVLSGHWEAVDPSYTPPADAIGKSAHPLVADRAPSARSAGGDD